MKRTIKTILMVVGAVLLVYGIYKLIVPEASIGIGDLSIDVQDNTDAYMTIGLGLVAMALGFLGAKKP
ncbi:hypothetical protein [Gelidibacter maritimus]|uniref:DUF3185 family protein n=1 Tax=Gelidibacter maritimus TaxID=2761487 RepID=A0A7W2M6T0_9FLAO|nr:hypothetical protein [Gelidibacter maritimus]MBA6153766.1 hypothetical protein [Gelidibacter maritimus]